MALSILDGNQSATTLSTIVTSGQHIPAHTVVSLGTQAISNITSAVSGTSVTFGLVGGTVTANNFTLTNVLQYDGSHYFLKVGGVATTGGTSFPVYVAGSVTANPTGTQTIAGTVTANLDPNSSVISSQIEAGIGSYAADLANDPFPISGTVTIGSALPTGINRIGVVTANGLSIGSTVANVFPIGVDTQFSGVRSVTDLIGYRLPISLGDSSAVVSASLYDPLPAGTNRIGVVTIGAGTVTLGASTAQIGSVTVGNSVTIGSLPNVKIQGFNAGGGGQYIDIGVTEQGAVPVVLDSALPAGTAQIGSVTASISGTVPISISSVTVGNSVTIGSLPAISGTVTANSSNGSLTTRFGSVTTANTAFATSAVTNSNRKYLLIQNVTTASNVITVGIGFTPTTTQGIQLFSGAGLTFEGSYIPTGAVNLLSSVTASCFTILEA